MWVNIGLCSCEQVDGKSCLNLELSSHARLQKIVHLCICVQVDGKSCLNLELFRHTSL